MAQDMLTAYKMGWKTSYYQNTYDFKGEEEEVQPAGLSATVEEEGEDVELTNSDTPVVNGHGKVNGNTTISTVAVDDSDECEACTI